MATYEYIKGFIVKIIQDGEATTLAEYEAKLDELTSNKSAICTGLMKYTVKELTGMTGYGRVEKKDFLIEQVYHRLGEWFLIPYDGQHTGHWLNQESYEQYWKRVLSHMTQEMLDKYRAKVLAQKAKVEKAIALPETFEEYKIFANKMGLEAFTPAMREQLDMFMAYEGIGKIREEMERAAVVQKIELAKIDEELEFVVIPGFHTKWEVPITTIQLNKRIPTDEWRKLDDKAQKFGGRYSAWRGAPTGWVFRNESDAAAFLDLQAGDGNVLDRWEKRKAEKQQKAAERLSEMADRKEESGEDALNADRKVNTWKRANEALYAEATARQEIKMANVLRSIADALQREEVFLLAGIRHATEIEMLESMLERAKREAIRKENTEYGYYEKNKDREVTLSDIRYAEMPYPYIMEGEMKSLLKESKGKRGQKWNLARLGNIKPIKEVCTTRSQESIAALRELLDLHIAEAGNGSSNWKYIKGRFEDYDRLWRIGIRNGYALRASLREFMQFRDASMPKIDLARVMELDLVGLKIPDYFPTPLHVVDQMIDLAGIGDNGDGRYLEPSAGAGRIAEKIRAAMTECSNLEVCEINYRLREILKLKGFTLVDDDFIALVEDLKGQQIYDAILMNPPFSNDQDQFQIMAAYELLVNGGVLVAILSAGSRKQVFSDWLDGVSVEYDELLPEGTFKESGTGTRTRMIMVRKGDGTECQDRSNYTDTQDRENYTEGEAMDIELNCTESGTLPDLGDFDALEFSPVVILNKGEFNECVERTDNPEGADMWTIYGHLKAGGCEAWHDTVNRDEGLKVLNKLVVITGFPVTIS